MKYLLATLVALLSSCALVSASTGTTSTGSTSTGATSSGITLPDIKKGGGGITLAWNYTTARIEMYPQCFPWIWASDYFEMNIVDMYANQEACRSKRLIDFR